MRFWQRLFNRQRLRRRELFEDFIENIYLAEDLSREQAKINLEEAVVEIVYDNGEHLGCGLLISTDGYFLTCRHCLDGLQNLSIVTHDKKEYRIKKICLDSQADDLVLAKAAMPMKAKALRFKFWASTKPPAKPAVLLTRRSGDLQLSGGFTSDLSVRKIVKERLVSELLAINAFTKKGDSGGVIVALPDYRVLGISHFGSRDNSYDSAGSQWQRALQLLIFYKKRI